jgi:adenylylsulfate kinase
VTRWPRAASAALCAFLGMADDEAMDSGAGRHAERRGDGRAPRGTGSAWLDRERLAQWEATSGDLLDELGYARRGPRPSALQVARAAEVRDEFDAEPLPARWRGVGRSAKDGCVVWLTGLSGAGKSTVARLVERALRDRGLNVEVLEGDAVRRNLSSDLGFSRKDRDTNIRRIAYVADLLSRNGVTVVVAAISPYRAIRDEARGLMGARFLEVHVRASVATCAARDVKGLYAKALKGEIAQFTGISDPYEAPTRPDLVLDTEREAPEASAATLLAHIDARSGSPQRGGAGELS